MEKAVDLSRVYSQEALQHILNASSFFKTLPRDSEIKDEDNEFLLNQIRAPMADPPSHGTGHAHHLPSLPSAGRPKPPL
ncbi:MAG: hypothetical protein IIT58_08355 [Treponema sp.]|nr:hypothetical protein [Treponema sp.]